MSRVNFEIEASGLVRSMSLVPNPVDRESRVEAALERAYEAGRESLARAFGAATSNKPSLYALAIAREFKLELIDMHQLYMLEKRHEAAMALEWAQACLESVEQKARADAAGQEIASLREYAATLENTLQPEPEEK